MTVKELIDKLENCNPDVSIMVRQVLTGEETKHYDIEGLYGIDTRRYLNCDRPEVVNLFTIVIGRW